jgi:hypothetical protein
MLTGPYTSVVTAAQIIHEIDSLPPLEKAKVVNYTKKLEESRHLNGNELAQLANQMVAAQTPAESDRLKSAIMKGFYGDE